MQLHVLFDDLAANFLHYADMIAERATALGGRAEGTARMSAASSRLEELPVATTDGKDFVMALADRFGEYAASARSVVPSSLLPSGLKSHDSRPVCIHALWSARISGTYQPGSLKRGSDAIDRPRKDKRPVAELPFGMHRAIDVVKICCCSPRIHRSQRSDPKLKVIEEVPASVLPERRADGRQ